MARGPDDTGVELLARWLEGRIAAGDIPGAVWGIDDPGSGLLSGAQGLRAVLPREEPASADTIWDLASLTKPLATTTILLRLVEQGAVALEQPAARWLPELDGADHARITLAHLASHRSGLPAWHPLYTHGATAAAYLAAIAALPLEAPPGERAVYSDLGFILLGAILERASGESLDRLTERHVAGPLGCITLRFLPPAADAGRIAPTEKDQETERAMVAERGLHYDGWRPGVLRGTVHDANVGTLGGVAGSAGLFGTLEDVIAVAREYLGRGRGLLSPASRALAQAPLPAAGEVRTIGWQGGATAGSAAEGVLPPESFGHNGFTGPSLWLDPRRARVYALMTNRVHPAVRCREMNALRREFHRIAASIG